MKFNLIPYDTEAYLVAADYAEEQGKLLTNAIRKKILPFDIEKNNGEGCILIFCRGDGYGNGEGCVLNSWWDNSYGHGDGLSFGHGQGHGWGIGRHGFGY